MKTLMYDGVKYFLKKVSAQTKIYLREDSQMVVVCDEETVLAEIHCHVVQNVGILEIK